MAVYRAGGHIDRGDGKGWVPDDTPPEPVPEPVAHKPMQPTVEVAGGWRLVPEPPPPDPESEPEPPKPKGSKSKGSKAERPSSAEVRAWAKAEGIDVPARGWVSDDLIDRYLRREK